MIEICPLCHFTHTNQFFYDNKRTYLRCPQCKLIFVSRDDLLTAKEEKARYDFHENNPDNEGYIRFLMQFVKPFIQHIGPPPINGLDFGSGPGPVLAMIMAENGYNMKLYDPYYDQNPVVLEQTYDFVTCTETFEHFYYPHKEWQLLLRLIKPGGWLGIMTKLVEDPQDFPNMHYKNDMTHVSFLSQETFLYLAKKDNLHVEFEADNLIFFQKQSADK